MSYPLMGYPNLMNESHPRQISHSIGRINKGSDAGDEDNPV